MACAVQSKKIRNKENLLSEAIPNSSDFTKDSDNKILISQLLERLPLKGKLIMEQIYIQGQTEKEVAHNLQISQQAVNKWKRKMIYELSMIVSC